MTNYLALLANFINTPLPRGHGGIRLADDDVRPLQIVVLDDGGNSDIAAEAVRTLVRGDGELPKANFLLGPYSSYLTEGAVSASEELGTLLLAPAAALSSVFTGKKLVFGMINGAAIALHPLIDALYNLTTEDNKRSINKVAFIAENSPVMLEYCEGAMNRARALNPNSAMQRFVFNYTDEDSNTTADSVRDLLRKLKIGEWDAVIGCTYTPACRTVLKKMADEDDPMYVKAVSFPFCMRGDNDLSDLRLEAEYMIFSGYDGGPIKTSHFNMTPKWTPEDIFMQYRASFFIDPSGSSFSTLNAGLLLVYAIEACAQNVSKTYDTTECMSSARIADVLRSGDPLLPATTSSHGGWEWSGGHSSMYAATRSRFQTLVGELGFDENQQAIVPSWLYQLTPQSGSDNRLMPTLLTPGALGIKMIPPWKERWCNYYRFCVGGTCDEHGNCNCDGGQIRVPTPSRQVEPVYSGKGYTIYQEPGECRDFFISNEAMKRVSASVGGLVAVVCLLVAWRKSRDIRR